MFFLTFFNLADIHDKRICDTWLLNWDQLCSVEVTEGGLFKSSSLAEAIP